jgi:tetratricopeptide (TPR) repeat protein
MTGLRHHRRTAVSVFSSVTVRVLAAATGVAGWLVLHNLPPPAPGRPLEARRVGERWAPYERALRDDTDLAVRRLEAAAHRASPADAAPWSDLAAAYLERGERHADPQDLMLALASALRAVARNPGMAEARFNLALTLERFSLRAQAVRQWQDVLRDERDRGWALEAREHLTLLTAPRSWWQTAKQELASAAAHQDRLALRRLIAAWPQACREYVEEELLPAWAAAHLAGRSADAARLLALSRAIAGSLVAAKRDGLASDTVAEIDRSLQAPDPLCTASLARGLSTYGAALALIKAGRYSRALPPLRTALRWLAGQKSPFAGWAVCQIAYCRYQRYEYGAAIRTLVPLIDPVRAQPSRALHGRALWLAGLIQLIRGDLSAGTTALQAAAADFNGLGEADHVAALQALVAMGLADLGRQNEAWRALHAALREAPEGAFARTAVYSPASWIALQEGELEIALRLQDEMLQTAGDSGTYAAVTEGLYHRAAILIALGDTTAAGVALQKAKLLLPRIPDARTRRLTAGNVLRAEGRLRLLSSPLAAIDLLDRAITILRTTYAHWSLAAALYERAVAERAIGRDTDEGRDLTAALAESERQRERITPLEQRIGYFDQHRATVDALVAFHLAHRAPRQAFQVNEQARARTLLDWTLGQPTGAPTASRDWAQAKGPGPPELLSKALPADTLLVEYRIEDAGLAVWSVSRSGLRYRSVAVAPARLEALVHDLVGAATHHERAAFLAASAALYEILILPVAPLLTPGCRLVFVPDGALHALPFAMLRNGRSGRFLVQDHASSVVPSAAVFGRCLRGRLPARARRDRS